jgi:hypothetical protein
MENNYFENNLNRNEPEPFKGLNLMDKYGSVKLPEDAKEVNLGNDLVESTFKDKKGNEYTFYINKPELNKILLEVNDANLFRIGQGKFMVLVKVKNIHLPFYISSAGTSGKKQGEWYPFFGYAGLWLVKGNVSENGKMEYHSEITKVQEILNQNLKIPTQYISPKGKFGGGPRDESGSEPLNVSFDLNQHFKYQNFYFTGEGEVLYTKRITGYDPAQVINDGGESSEVWIKHIIEEIK